MPRRLIDAPLNKQPFPIPPNARFRITVSGWQGSEGDIVSLDEDDGTELCFFNHPKNGRVCLYNKWLGLLDECAPKIVQGITLKDCEATRHEDVGKRIISKSPYRNSITGWLLAHRPNQGHLILCDGSWEGGEATNSEDERYVPLGTKKIAYVASYELVEETPKPLSMNPYTIGIDLSPTTYANKNNQVFDPKVANEMINRISSAFDFLTPPKRTAHTIMNNVITAIKNLALTAEDKLLRKHEIENSNGEITEKGYELSAYLAYKANRDAIVKHLKEVEAEESKSKSL